MAAVEVPKWLTSILDANFHDPCKEHRDKENTHFCLDCNGKVLCKTCKTQSSMHAGHKVLQVYKASHRAVLRIQDIGLLFDISDIHPYSINSYSIVFLRPRIKEANHVSHANAAHKCKICGYQFPKSSRSISFKLKRSNSFRFCSLACKAKSCMMDFSTLAAHGCAKTEVLMISQVVIANESVIQIFPESQDQENMTVPVAEPPKSFRKRNRKGIPKRAPFF